MIHSQWLRFIFEKVSQYKKNLNLEDKKSRLKLLTHKSQFLKFVNNFDKIFGLEKIFFGN